MTGSIYIPLCAVIVKLSSDAVLCAINTAGKCIICLGEISGTKICLESSRLSADKHELPELYISTIAGADAIVLCL